MSLFLIYIIAVLAAVYLINIIGFIIGINKTYKPSKSNKNISVSIIIAIKNGGDSVPKMLNALSSQKYNGKMEFILVDDNSTDDTKNYIVNYSLKDDRFKYISSNNGSMQLKHKKRALDAGVQASKYEYLLFTDIDCVIQPNWVESISRYFAGKVDYIIGHTYVNTRKTILNKFQRIDLLMLLFASYGSTAIGSPWACSGQNQAYTKTLYNNIGGLNPLSQYLQGDDTLFLQLAIKKHARIVFATDPQSYVISRTESSWKDLFLQRARWSGDVNVMWKFNLAFYLAAISTFSINASMIILLFTPYFQIGLIIILLKLLFETIMYISGMRKIQNGTIHCLDFILWSLVVPLYTIIMGGASFLNITWKGKSLK